MLAQRYADRRPYMIVSKRRPYKEHLLGRYPEYKPGLDEMAETASTIDALDESAEAAYMRHVLLWDLAQWLLAGMLYRGGLSSDNERVQVQHIVNHLAPLVIATPDGGFRAPVPDITLAVAKDGEE